MHPIYINEPAKKLNKTIKKINPDRIAIIVDENTKKHCLPSLLKQLKAKKVAIIKIESGEENKDIDTVQEIWEQMYQFGLTRKSLTINLGGGVIGDMGGFSASTYMRGMIFLQMPTTLLSMVDASVGGKLGVDFHQMKNFVGVFREPELVWIDTTFLKTLPSAELKSGFGEVIKHALIADADLWKKLIESKKVKNWKKLVSQNVEIKKAVVTADPLEHGPRKILNYGHTVGHAVESHFLASPTPLLHGYAIGIGMMIENIISVNKGILANKASKKINQFIKSYYKFKTLQVKEVDIDTMIGVMKMDKKNSNGEIKMSLIEAPGLCHYNIPVTPSEIRHAIELSGLLG